MFWKVTLSFDNSCKVNLQVTWWTFFLRLFSCVHGWRMYEAIFQKRRSRWRSKILGIKTFRFITPQVVFVLGRVNKDPQGCALVLHVGAAQVLICGMMKIVIDTVAIDVWLCLILVILFDLFLDERGLITIQILIFLKKVPHDFFFSSLLSLCHLPEPHHA